MFLFHSPNIFPQNQNRTYRTYWDFSLCFMVIVMLRDFRDFRNYLGGERRGGVVFGWIRWFGGVFCVTLW